MESVRRVMRTPCGRTLRFGGELFAFTHISQHRGGLGEAHALSSLPVSKSVRQSSVSQLLSQSVN